MEGAVNRDSAKARIILYTGKGGVGKTSVAASTALRCSQLGYRTVVLSTDAAHSLADSFDCTLGARPTALSSNLWGQEVDVFYEIRANWGTVQEYVSALMAWRGLDQVVAEELTILPGIEELISLLQITDHHDSGQFDVIIVDCAPTGETLRLLSFPEVARWWMEKIFPIQRRVSKTIRPLVRTIMDMPLPDDPVFDSLQHLFAKLDQMHRLLADTDKSSVRLVLNPEKMVIKEAQRTFTYLNLFGYPVDAIVCNRIIPGEVHDQYFESWKAAQGKYYQMAEEGFSPLPILSAPLFDQEVVGQRMLEVMGRAIFADRDPHAFFYRGQIHTVKKDNGAFVLTIALPFVDKQDVSLTQHRDELIVQVGNQRRNIVLPRALVGLTPREAKLADGKLTIKFPQG
ncbi:MAG: ArsA family ATPase [Chloroflexota bacterium]|nr:MAG: ArsA family ATPase [Chloroflexota bacterium]